MSNSPLKKRKMSYEKKKGLVGYGFIGMWLIGFFVLYAYPLVMSFVYGFNELTITTNGFAMEWKGIDNFIYIFRTDPDYMPALASALKDLLYQVPLVMVFSLILALLINQEFHGRTAVRAIFFLPVIIASGVVIEVINGDMASQMMQSGEKTSQMFQVTSLASMLQGMNLPDELTSFVVSAANNIFELVWKSGIQIVLFLSALQSIPPTLYEAASIDGGTKWEIFWKVTFPMITPMLLVNMVYTITDTFTAYGNGVMNQILNAVRTKIDFDYSAALAWVYFVIIIAILGIVIGFVNRKVTYLD